LTTLKPYVYFILQALLVVNFVQGSGERIVQTQPSDEVCTAEEQFVDAAFTNDNAHIVASTTTGHVYLFDRELEQVRFRYTYAHPYALSIEVSPAHDFIVLYDRSDITNAATSTLVLNMAGEVVQQFAGSTGVSLSDRLVLTYGGADSNSPSRIWNIETGETETSLEEYFGHSPLVSPDQKWLLELHNITAGRTELRSLPNFERAFVFPPLDPELSEIESPTTNGYNAGAFSPEYVGLAHESAIYLWRLDALELHNVISVRSEVALLRFSRSGDYMLTAYSSVNDALTDGSVELWSTEDFTEPLHTFPSYQVGCCVAADAIDFAPDETSLLILHDDNVLRTWDVATGQRLAERRACVDETNANTVP